MDPALEEMDVNGAKRKSEDTQQQRTKRSRYTSIACNECKRRKIKCNGQTPCARCGNLSLACVYASGADFKDSEEWRQMNAQIALLQEQVDTLFANLSSLRSELAQNNPPLDPSLQNGPYDGDRPPPAPMLSPESTRPRSRNGARQPTFRGPTSNAFSFDVAKSSLQHLGISPEAPEESDRADEGNPFDSPRPQRAQPPFAPQQQHRTKDPIWSISSDEALRLLKVYEEDMHEMYPVISLSQLTTHANALYKFMIAMFQSDMVRLDMPGADGIHDEDTNLLKMTLAIALHVEGHGKSELGQRLFEDVQPHIDALLLGNAGIKAVRLLALAAMYNFHCDNEGTSWRIIGLTARLCIELGLHRKATYDIMSSEDRDSTVNLFWSIYNLDRRWSFGTGMPFALQDADIDPALPRPGDKSPYLTAMIKYSAIGSKVWQAIGAENSSTETSSVTKEEIGFLDYQIRQWHRNLPSQLQFDHYTLDSFDNQSMSMSSLRPRLTLYLRRNSMLIHIYRPVLYSASSITQNQQQAQEVVNIAKDTIRNLTRINQSSDLYQTSQTLFNPFLTSALAVLFLAASHSPANFADQVREEFTMALDLVRGISKGSWISQRLWKTVRLLKEVAPKLGLASAQGGQQAPSKVLHQQKSSTSDGFRINGSSEQEDDPSRSAALAMAGLAGHKVDDSAIFGNTTGSGDSMGLGGQMSWPTAAASVPTANPDNMANDLTRLFELAAETFGNGSHAGNDSGSFGASGTPGGPGAAVVGYGGEDELSRIMRDLF